MKLIIGWHEELGVFFPIAHPALGSPLSVVKSVCSSFIFLNLILLIARGGLPGARNNAIEVLAYYPKQFQIRNL